MASIVKRGLMGLVTIGMLCVGLIALGMLVQSSTRTADAASGAPKGVVRNFTLYVRDNYIPVPNGDPIYVIGFTDDPHSKAQVPGPTLDINQGDTVNLTLMNDKDPTQTALNPSGDGHTIHLHGLDLESMNDGDPMTAPEGQIRSCPATVTPTISSPQNPAPIFIIAIRKLSNISRWACMAR